MYDSLEEFLKSVIKEYYYTKGHTPSGKLNFLALLLASGRIIPAIKDKFREISLEKKIAASAITVVALRLLLTRILAGPLSIILSAATIASLIMLFINNRTQINSKLETFKSKLDKLQRDYEDIQGKYKEGKYGLEERNLIIDGLKSRFLAEL